MFTVVETDAAMEDMRETLAYLKYRTGGEQSGARLLDAYEKLIGVLEATPSPIRLRPITSSRFWGTAELSSGLASFCIP